MSEWQVSRQCPECPWRRDVPVGVFSAERFARLAGSVEEGFAPMFACHATPEQSPRACVGYVLSQIRTGVRNFNLRRALASGRIDPDAMVSEGPQYESFAEMAEANGLRSAT